MSKAVGNMPQAALVGTSRSPARPGYSCEAAPGPEGSPTQWGESAALLKELAVPKILEFEGAAIAVQTKLIDGLEDAIAKHEATSFETQEAEVERRQEAILLMLAPLSERELDGVLGQRLGRIQMLQG